MHTHFQNPYRSIVHFWRSERPGRNGGKFVMAFESSFLCTDKVSEVPSSGLNGKIFDSIRVKVIKLYWCVVAKLPD